MEFRRRTWLCALPLTLLVHVPQRAAAETKTVLLPTVAGAGRYEGDLIMAGKTFRVRTSAPWILCPNDCDLNLSVYSDDGKLLGYARMSSGVTDAPPLVQADSVTAPAPNIAAEDVQQPPTPKHESPSPRTEPTPARPRGTPSFVAVTLGLGKEWLKANGGVGEYQGSAGIGGTILNVVFRPTAGSLGIDAEVAAHNYATATTMQDVGTDTTTTQQSKFLRLRARASAFYDFLQGATGGPTFGLGLGIETIKMPALTVSDKVTATADLKEQGAVGPAVTLVAGTTAEAAHQFVALVDYMPLSLSKAWGATSTAATMSWRYAFATRLATDVSAHVQSATLKGKVDCLAVTRCTADSSAKTAVVQARLGLGYRF